MKPKWRYRSARTFFGLTDEYMQAIYETFFYLKYYGGWSFSEAYNLPIGLRKWFIERLAKQMTDENEAQEASMRGNGSQTQTLTPFNQPSMPSHMKPKGG